jgi:hypothetical protein
MKSVKWQRRLSAVTVAFMLLSLSPTAAGAADYVDSVYNSNYHTTQSKARSWIS